MDDTEALKLQYLDHEETIENCNVIAVIESKPPVGKVEHEKLYKILQVCIRESVSAQTEFGFESIPVTGLPVSFLKDHLGSIRPPHLCVPLLNGVPNFHIVISVRSGTGEPEQFFANVVRPALAAYGFEHDSYHILRTESETSITEVAKNVFLPLALNGVKQTILLLSGDGGIADLVNVFQSCKLDPEQERCFAKPTVGLVAMGTGNALANSTGINSDMTRGLRHFFRGTAQQLPTFAAKFSTGSKFLVDEGRLTKPLFNLGEDYGVVYGAVVCSWGLHASLVADSDTTEYRKHGVERFQMAAKELLAPSDGSAPHVYKGRLTLFRRSRNGQVDVSLDRLEHMYILATLVSNLEQKLNISPYSKPLDGQLRLLHFGPMSSERVMEILGKAFTDGSHIHDEAVGYEEIYGLRIDFDEENSHWRRVCVDGKIVKVGKNGWVEVRMCEKSQLNLLLMPEERDAG